METQRLCADYLVVGAGIAGLNFVDVLLKHDQACTVIIADLYARPGGKYNLWPSYCTLDASSSTWGVPSKKFEGSSPDDVLRYCQLVMDDFVRTKRVQFLPKFRSDAAGSSLVSVLDQDNVYTLQVGRKVVDATSTMPRVPCGPLRSIQVDPAVQFICPGELATIDSVKSQQYVVVGAGFIGINTVLWLLSMGVAPAKISWVMPRVRLLRAREGLAQDQVANQLTTLMAIFCTVPSMQACTHMIEEAGIGYKVRAKPEIWAFRCCITKDEVASLAKVTNVIRKGYVRRISPGLMDFTDGKVETLTDATFIDCTGSRTRYQAAPEQVFQAGRIKIQKLHESNLVDTCMSAALCAMIEANDFSDAYRNRMCTPYPYSETTAEYLAASLPPDVNGLWNQNPKLAMDRLSLRVGPIQVSHAKSWYEPTMVNRVRDNIAKVLARECPGAIEGLFKAHAANVYPQKELPPNQAVDAQQVLPKKPASQDEIFDFDELDEAMCAKTNKTSSHEQDALVNFDQLQAA